MWSRSPLTLGKCGESDKEALRVREFVLNLLCDVETLIYFVQRHKKITFAFLKDFSHLTSWLFPNLASQENLHGCFSPVLACKGGWSGCLSLILWLPEAFGFCDQRSLLQTWMSRGRKSNGTLVITTGCENQIWRDGGAWDDNADFRGKVTIITITFWIFPLLKWICTYN